MKLEGMVLLTFWYKIMKKNYLELMRMLKAEVEADTKYTHNQPLIPFYLQLPKKMVNDTMKNKGGLKTPSM